MLHFMHLEANIRLKYLRKLFVVSSAKNNVLVYCNKTTRSVFAVDGTLAEKEFRDGYGRVSIRVGHINIY